MGKDSSENRRVNWRGNEKALTNEYPTQPTSEQAEMHGL